MSKMVLILLIVACGFQQEEISETAKRYAEQLVAARKTQLAELDAEISKLRKAKASKQEIAKARQRLESLESNAEFQAPAFNLPTMSEGQFGAFRTQDRKGSQAFEYETSFYVVEIIDADSVAVSIEGKVTVILNGVETADLTTEGIKTFPVPFEAKSIQPYTTPSGQQLKIWSFDRVTDEAAALTHAKKLLKKKK